MSRNGPGRAGNGNFAPSDIRVFAANKKGGQRVPVKLVNPKATHQQNTAGLSVASSIDSDKRKSGWAVDLEVSARIRRRYLNCCAGRFRGRYDPDGGDGFREHQPHHRSTPVGGDCGALTGGDQGDSSAASVATLLAAVKQVGSVEKLDAKQRAALLKIYRAQDAEWTKLNNHAQQHLASKPVRRWKRCR